jgi:hypothetical protein
MPKRPASLLLDEEVDAQLAELGRRWGRGEFSRGSGTSREGLASRCHELGTRLGGLPAFNADDVADRWDEMGLPGRRAVLTRVFERIEVRQATTRGYEPEQIKLSWRTPMWRRPLTAPPNAGSTPRLSKQGHHALR